MDWSYRGAVEFSVLGPLRVTSASGVVEIRGVKERLVLGHLVAGVGRVVPTDDLVDGLWGDSPPRTAAKSLQNYVLRLRNVLEPDRDGPARMLVTDGPGYRLAVDPREVDAERFVRLVAAADQARAQDRLDVLREALGLWRGSAYAGLAEAPRLAAEAARLEELRLVALERLHTVELELGRTAEAVAGLERLVSEHPLRERCWSLLATALYRDGRQGEALGALDRARAVLAEELGIDPGEELRQLHARVLAQDPGLVLPRAGELLPRALLAPTTPVHGRDHELALLRAEEGTVVLRGPAGAGALTLAQVVAEEVAADGGRVRYVGPRGPDPDDAGPVDLLVLDRVPWPPGPTTGRVIVVDPPEGAFPPGATVVDLPPLARPAVRALVAGYVSGADLDAATEHVLAASHGWPEAAHAAAIDYVRASAGASVEAAASEAARSRASLQEARSRVTAGVLDLQGIDGTGRPDPDRCPWPGLAAYDVDEGDWFAGRERLVAELVARTAGATCLAVVGASGSGKSSAVRAGLLAALAADRLPGSAVWDQVLVRPGAHPMRELAEQVLGARRPDPGEILARLVRSSAEAGPGRTLLVVDQFEEVWTTCADEAERAAFLDTLGDLAVDPERGVTLVVVLRADYLDRLADHPALAGAVAENTVLVGTPTGDDVRRAVERPGRRGGLTFDDGLVDAVVADAGNEPGLLPLLSTALAQLWEHREGRRLTFGAYVGLGGLAGAISHLAEAAHADLDARSQDAARRVLLRLSGPGEGSAVTRRRVPLAELAALPGEDVLTVVERLADARLLSLSGEHVEVAHEALYREWPRLRGWLAEDVAGRAVQRRLAVAAGEWHAEGREAAMLWRGSRLDAGLEVAALRPEEVTAVERAFLDAGREAAEADRRDAERRAQEKTRQNRRLRRVLGGTTVLLVLAVVSGLLALLARGEAAEAARAADAKRLAATALSLEYPDLALLAAVEATKLEESPETYGALLTLLARQPDVVTRFRTENRFLRNAVTPDGTVVLLSENEPVLHALDATTGDVRWTVRLPGQVGRIAPAPDGGAVAVSVLAGRGGLTMLLDADTGAELWRTGIRAARRLEPDVAPFFWYGLEWTADGRLALPTDTHVFLLDDTGAVRSAVPWGRPVRDTQAFTVWPDGRASTGSLDPGVPGTVIDLDAPGARPRTTTGSVVAVSPDGTLAAEMLLRRTGVSFRVLDAATMEPTAPAWPLDGEVMDAAFSPDGRRVALAVGEEVLVRDARTGAPTETLVGHSGAVMSVAYAGSDGGLLWTAGRDGSAVAFDATGSEGVVGRTASRDSPMSGEASPASGHAIWMEIREDGPNRPVLRRSGESRGRPLPATGLDCFCQATGTDLSADGRVALAGYLELDDTFAVVPGTGHVLVWDATSRDVLGAVETPWPVNAVAATPDGTSAVVNGTGGWAVLDLTTMALGEPFALPPVDPWFEGTALAEVAPDGARAALLRGDRVVLVDLTTGETLAERVLEGTAAGPGLSAAAFTRDGELAVGSLDGWLHVVDDATLEPAAPRRLITGGFVIDVEVSPDGRTAATLGTDGDAMLWDVATWRPYGERVVDGGGWGYLAFDRGSSRLTIESEQGHRTTVGVEPEEWVAAACAAANRDLTPDEVAVILPGTQGIPTCAG